MLKVISNKTAFELLTMDKEEENNKVYFKEERNNNLCGAVDVVWNFKIFIAVKAYILQLLCFFEEDCRITR